MIISNSSPLILLAKINKLDLLKALYKQIYIPKAVYQEVIVKGKEEKYGDVYLIEKMINDTIFIKELNEENILEAKKFSLALGKGESEAIALSIQEKADLFLVDNLEPRKVAQMNNIKCRGTPGILLEALKRQKINCGDYINLIKLLASFAWLSGDIVAYFLEQGYKFKGEKHENK